MTLPTALLLASTGPAQDRPAEDWTSRLTAQVFESKAHGPLPYRLFTPAKTAAPPLPLVLFLHGAGERGVDNRRQLRHGVQAFVGEAAQAKRPCFVLAPQCPRGRWWNIPQVIELLQSIRDRPGIDVRRIYVTGLSMGGYGTWHAIGVQPELFAAALPICGGGRLADVGKIHRLPIWAFHGGADPVVAPALSRAMIEAIRKRGGEPKYTEYEGVKHDSWTRTYANEEVLEWLFAQRRQVKGRSAKRPNILFLISDDLGAQALGCYGNPQCKTPAIDGLARRGVRFTRAYCQFPVCGPSRAALMSGMYPRSIGVMGNGGARSFTKNLGQRPSMTGHFIRHGWAALRVSKIYHMRVPGDITKGVHGPDHEASWTARYSVKAPEWYTNGEAEHLTRERLKFDRDKHYNLGFGGAFYVVQGSSGGAEQADVLAADRAIALLGKLGKDGQPFFLAVGFVRPHVPLVAPTTYFEPYPADQMRLPARVDDDQADIPRLGISKNSKQSGLSTDAKKRRVLRAYYAAVAFMDAQVARVLAALDRHGLRDDTIVVFTSDHGYHLGEHDFWQKLSLHEESARIPLVISGPGIEPSTTGALAQQIDIYPTLARLAGLAIPAHVEGKSLTPVLEQPDTDVHTAIHCTNRRGQLIRTKRWAYLAWRDDTAELYDMQNDPKQFTNLADREAHRDTITKLRRHLQK